MPMWAGALCFYFIFFVVLFFGWRYAHKTEGLELRWLLIGWGVGFVGMCFLLFMYALMGEAV